MHTQNSQRAGTLGRELVSSLTLLLRPERGGGERENVMKWLWLTSVQRRVGAQDSTTVTPAFLMKHLLRSFRLGPDPNPNLVSVSELH